MDRRVTKTKTAIREACFKLLREHPDGHISIAQIARVADIDRKTFYLHYDSIEAIIHEYLYEQVGIGVEGMMNNGYFDNPLRADLMFDALEETTMVKDPELLKRILNSPYAKEFWNELISIMVNTSVEIYRGIYSCSSEEFEVSVRFFAHGFVAVYQDWLNRAVDTDLKELMRITHLMMHGGIDQLFDNDNKEETVFKTEEE